MQRLAPTPRGIKIVDPTERELKFLYYHEGHDFCALCHIPERVTPLHRYPQSLQLAHILGGAYRVNQPWNVVLLCSACHSSQHDGQVVVDDKRWPQVTRDNLFWAKWAMGELHPDLLATLWGRTLEYVIDLAETSIPSEDLLAERRKWPTPKLLLPNQQEMKL